MESAQNLKRSIECYEFRLNKASGNLSDADKLIEEIRKGHSSVEEQVKIMQWVQGSLQGRLTEMEKLKDSWMLKTKQAEKVIEITVAALRKELKAMENRMSLGQQETVLDHSRPKEVTGNYKTKKGGEDEQKERSRIVGMMEKTRTQRPEEGE